MVCLPRQGDCLSAGQEAYVINRWGGDFFYLGNHDYFGTFFKDRRLRSDRTRGELHRHLRGAQGGQGGREGESGEEQFFLESSEKNDVC